MVEVNKQNTQGGQSTENRRSVVSLPTVLCVVCVLVTAASVGYQVFKEQKEQKEQKKQKEQRSNSLNHAAEQTLQQVNDFNEELRILLVGKTGVGKSATGNTILSKQAFKSEISSSSVTAQCDKAHENVNGRKVSVIDSPGLFDTQLTLDEVVNRIKMCIPFSAPGPHVFLVVIQLGRFTDEEEKTVQIFQEIFGKDSSTYTMALFTHGDKLKGKSIHRFIRNNTKLLNFIKKCGGRYHMFNNEDQNPEQVVQLLDQIDKMVTGNGGGHYTTEMLQEAERAIEEEKQRILKANEERRLKEIEELKKKLEGEALEKARKELQEKEEREAREQAERNPSLLKKISNFISSIFKAFF